MLLAVHCAVVLQGGRAQEQPRQCESVSGTCSECATTDEASL